MRETQEATWIARAIKRKDKEVTIHTDDLLISVLEDRPCLSPIRLTPDQYYAVTVRVEPVETKETTRALIAPPSNVDISDARAEEIFQWAVTRYHEFEHVPELSRFYSDLTRAMSELSQRRLGDKKAKK